MTWNPSDPRGVSPNTIIVASPKGAILATVETKHGWNIWFGGFLEGRSSIQGEWPEGWFWIALPFQIPDPDEGMRWVVCDRCNGAAVVRNHEGCVCGMGRRPGYMMIKAED